MNSSSNNVAYRRVPSSANSQGGGVDPEKARRDRINRQKNVEQISNKIHACKLYTAPKCCQDCKKLWTRINRTLSEKGMMSLNCRWHFEHINDTTLTFLKLKTEPWIYRYIRVQYISAIISLIIV